MEASYYQVKSVKIKRVSGFWSPRVSPQTRASAFLGFLLCNEMMSNCSQNCWINWNSAVLCIKRLFPHRGMNVCPICEASLSHHTLCMGFCPVPITAHIDLYMCQIIISLVGKSFVFNKTPKNPELFPFRFDCVYLFTWICASI